MFIMRHKVALTLQSVNKIPVRVTIEGKASKYYFHAELFITYFKVVVLWGSQYKRKKEGPKNTIQSLWRRANARNVSFFTLYGG